MDENAKTRLNNDLKVLKRELKQWEREFTDKESRKPEKQDIAKHADIAKKYKTYSKLKADLAKLGGTGASNNDLAEERAPDSAKPAEDLNVLSPATPTASAAPALVEIAAKIGAALGDAVVPSPVTNDDTKPSNEQHLAPPEASSQQGRPHSASVSSNFRKARKPPMAFTSTDSPIQGFINKKPTFSTSDSRPETPKISTRHLPENDGAAQASSAFSTASPGSAKWDAESIFAAPNKTAVHDAKESTVVALESRTAAELSAAQLPEPSPRNARAISADEVAPPPREELTPTVVHVQETRSSVDTTQAVLPTAQSSKSLASSRKSIPREPQQVTTIQSAKSASKDSFKSAEETSVAEEPEQPKPVTAEIIMPAPARSEPKIAEAPPVVPAKEEPPKEEREPPAAVAPLPADEPRESKQSKEGSKASLVKKDSVSPAASEASSNQKLNKNSEPELAKQVFATPPASPLTTEDLAKQLEAEERAKPPRQGSSGSLSQRKKRDVAVLSPEFFRPIPEEGLLKCRMFRKTNLIDKAHPTFYLYNESDDKFLLAARKRKKTKTPTFIISDNAEELSKESKHYLCKIKSNFQRTSFVVYDAREYIQGAEDKGLKQIGCVQYSKTVLPREMKIGIPPGAEKTWDSTRDIAEELKNGTANDMMVLRNKPPRWNELTQSHCLNFGGRVTQPSVKNFQLISNVDENHVVLQFGRCGADYFTMDVRAPMTPIVAFAIAISSFDAYDGA